MTYVHPVGGGNNKGEGVPGRAPDPIVTVRCEGNRIHLRDAANQAGNNKVGGCKENPMNACEEEACGEEIREVEHVSV